MKDIVIVGSIGYDSIKTPFGEIRNTLGGSVVHFINGASKLNPSIGVIGIVGYDFKDFDFFVSRGVDINDLKVKQDEKTFYWEGYYEKLDKAITIKTELNSFASFKPVITDNNRDAKIIFLANIDPDIQYDVLQGINCRLSFLDTMNLWIETKRSSLEKVLSRVDGIIINEEELYLLTRISNIYDSIKLLLDKSIKYVVVKKGSNGVMIFSNKGEFASYPSFFVFSPKDPTGAGDSFAGAFLSYISKNFSFDNSLNLEFELLKKSVIYANIVASFNVEGFGIEGLKDVKKEEIELRYEKYLKHSSIPKIF